MKDKIIKIIQKDNLGNNQLMNMYLPQDINKAASEIADMVKEFTEWMTCNHVYRATNYSSVLYTIYSDCHEYTLDELFNYWYNNIKEK